MNRQSMPSWTTSAILGNSRIAALAACVIAALLIGCSALAGAPESAYADEPLAAGTISAQAGTDYAYLGVSAKYDQTKARSMLDMVNDFRTGNDTWVWNEANTKKEWRTGLKKLTYDYGLERIAMQRAAEISLKMDHVRPDGETQVNALIDEVSPNWNKCLENLTTVGTTAQAAFDAWLEEGEHYEGQGHRRAMLDEEVTHVGIAYAVCQGIPCWVQVFSKPSVDTTYTAPINTTQLMTVKAQKSLISSEVSAPTASESSVSLCETAAVDLPSVNATVMVVDGANRMRVPITVENLTWTSADASIATVQNGKLVGKKQGTTTISATASLKSSTTVKVTVNVAENGLKGATVKLSSDSFTYDGTAKTPSVTVTKDGTTLSSADIESVTYENNVNAGTATVTVTGTGDYSGMAQKTFTIAPAASSISLAKMTATYTGKAIAYKGKVTKSGSTGAVSYKYYSDAACTKQVAAASVKNAGKYYVKATLAKDDNHKAATSSAALLTINKKANTFKAVPVKSVQTAYAKKKVTIKAKKAFKVTKNASGGKVTYKKTSGPAKIKVAKTGAITIAKGLKKGKTYTVKVKATAAATANYKAKASVVTFKVKVK